jgi:hypothetical protein
MHTKAAIIEVASTGPRQSFTPAFVTGIAGTWLRLMQSMGSRKKCKSTAFALLQQTTPHPQIRYNQHIFFLATSLMLKKHLIYTIIEE